MRRHPGCHSPPFRKERERMGQPQLWGDEKRMKGSASQPEVHLPLDWMPLRRYRSQSLVGGGDQGCTQHTEESVANSRSKDFVLSVPPLTLSRRAMLCLS